MKKYLTILCIVAAALLLVIAVAALLHRSSYGNDLSEAPQTSTSGQMQSTTQDTTAAQPEDMFGFDTRDEEETIPVNGAVTQEQAHQKPTQPSANAGTVEVPETTQEETVPVVNDTTTAVPPAPEKLTYEAYIAMNAQEQLAYMNGYADMEDFIAWFDAAKKEYDANNQGIEVTGPIDIEDFIKP